MNVVGRNASRSNSAAHHQRQYSDNLLDSSKWLHSSSQDFGYGSTMNRSLQSNETSTPPISSRSSSLRKNADDFQVSHSELTPGLLDLHSFDTELLSEVPVSNLYKGYSFSRRDQGKSFDDFEPYTAANKLSSNTNSVTKSSLVDKERANNVAKIKVLVRKRPLNKREATKKEEDIITIESNYLTVHETKLKVDLTEYVEKHEFVFDSVLKEGVSNDEVYSETVEPIVPLIFQRTKATCFAYGQTGSGKTYTMQPLPLKASQDILRLMHHTYRDQGFQLHFSFFEIYGGKLYDLLNERKKLCMREDGKQQVCIVGLEEFNVTDVGTIRELIEKGSATRSTGTTGANEESSRSHAILQLAIKRSANSSNSKPARLVGKLSFIDLAGSERGADTTDNDKQTRMEGAEINKSLLALKECIRALDSDQNHIPFRGSKLTEVLRDSFVGDSRTVMISCISPSSGSCEHTLNTLRYADRVKSLSKGSSSKKDPLSSRFRESTVLPLTTVLPNEFAFEDSTADALSEKKRFGWPKAYERESSSPHIVDRVPSGRAEGNLAASGYLGSFKGQRGGQNGNIKDSFDCTMETYDVEKPLQMNKNKRADAYQKSALEDRSRTDTLMKQRDASTSQPNNFHPDGDLIALLKEEEELVSAHRKQVEETMDIVKEEMKLLVEADQPGNQLHEYISKLNSILSQKAAGIIQLQTRLVQFQRRLNENNVLV